MKLGDLVVVGMAVLALTLFAGCQSGSSGGGSSSVPQDNGTPTENVNENVGDDETVDGTDDNVNAPADGEANDNGNDSPDAAANDNAADQQDAEPDDGQAALTEEEADAVNTGVSTVRNLAGLFAALGAGGLPSTDGGPITVNPFTGCPTITPDSSEDSLAFTIDYGQGCAPVLYPSSTFSGSISGEVNVVARTITLTFDDFVMDGITVEGTVEASASQDGDLLILESTVDVTFSDGEQTFTNTGDVTVQVNLATGEIFIPQADLSSVDETGDEYAIILTDVHIDLIEVLPDSGTATVVLGTVGAGALTVEITFTEDTPTDGTVLVSVNGSPPVTLSLEDIEVE